MSPRPLTIGSLCTGYGGLDMAAEEVFDAETIWTADLNPAAAKIIEHRWANSPTGAACRRWTSSRPATRASRSRTPGGGMGSTTRGTSGRSSRRQFAEYDPGTSSWKTWPDTGLWDSVPFSQIWPRCGTWDLGSASELPMSAPATAGTGSSSLLPTPTARDEKGANQRGDTTCLTGALLPTPRTSDTNGPGLHGDGGMDLRTAVTLLPTPVVTDATGTRNSTVRRSPGSTANIGDTLTDAVTVLTGVRNTGAVRRWERVTGRVAPHPTEPATRGGERLSPPFVEWMQGLPTGFVTEVPGLSRNDQLRALGNGVVKQQAAEALRRLLPLIATEVAA